MNLKKSILMFLVFFSLIFSIFSFFTPTNSQLNYNIITNHSSIGENISIVLNSTNLNWSNYSYANISYNSTILNLNTNNIYEWNGFNIVVDQNKSNSNIDKEEEDNKNSNDNENEKDNDNDDKNRIKLILENLKKFELFWLTKSLLVQRENIPIYKLKTEL